MLGKIRAMHPEMRIVVSSILPRYKDQFQKEQHFLETIQDQILQANSLLAYLAERTGANFLDNDPLFLDEQLMAQDGLHLTFRGSQVLAENMLQELLSNGHLEDHNKVNL